jgi:starch synthase
VRDGGRRQRRRAASPEVVVDGETGVLVPYDEADPGAFERGLAEAVAGVLADPARAAALGAAGRTRAVEQFGWDAVARQTLAVYEGVLRPGHLPA